MSISRPVLQRSTNRTPMITCVQALERSYSVDDRLRFPLTEAQEEFKRKLGAKGFAKSMVQVCGTTCNMPYMQRCPQWDHMQRPVHSKADVHEIP